MKYNILGLNPEINKYTYSKVYDKLQSKYIDFIKVLVDEISILSTHEYFSKQLWRDKFDFHPASVAIAFIARSLYHYGIYIIEVGSTFILTDDRSKSSIFLIRFESLFRDYASWCTKESSVDHFEVKLN